MTFKEHALDLNHYLLEILENKNSLEKEDVQELCAALNEYFLSEAFNLGLMPKASLTAFTEKYANGLGPDFNTDFSNLLESLSEAWKEESKLSYQEQLHKKAHPK